MFGVSLSELMLIGMVALVIVGPSRLPKLLGTLGQWAAKLRRITTEVRNQSGIDDILRKEGFSGGLSELRQLRNVARGGLSSLMAPVTPHTPQRAVTSNQGSAKPLSPNNPAASYEDPFADVTSDRSREYPGEGCDAAGCLPDDLWSDPVPAPARSSEAPAR